MLIIQYAPLPQGGASSLCRSLTVLKRLRVGHKFIVNSTGALMDDLVARQLQTQGDQISPASNQQDDLLPSPALASTFNLLIFDQLIKQTPAFRCGCKERRMALI